ncbi:hypothetical protein [Phenylobacterium sp. J367]|uniref:hypothetical protein n=1 Tax=Phenylobacterium sp. J367 TaxID=2898435 RepID=UPI00215107E9|nr:hypothetical protein [Phenylobacterium sp. J367]MCR5879646.1 hypothetical protein [Phenylobacterium sp. J367]
MAGSKDPVTRRRPITMILIAVAFAIAGTVAFLLYDANRPPALDGPPSATSAAR